MQKKEKIYFFDFDGTIIAKNSFVLFTYFSVTKVSFIKYWITTIFLFFIISKGKLKERFFNNFKDISYALFTNISNYYFNKYLNKCIKKSFLEFINNLEPNSKVVIVSASISNYLKSWCDYKGFDLISTELEVINGLLTGRFSTNNCNGQEKAKRIKEKYDLSIYDEIHVFGNSKGDFQMLDLGTNKYYKYFK